MHTPLHALILEDHPADTERIAHELRQAGFTANYRVVEGEAEYMDALNPALDVILASYALPGFSALRALELLRARGLDIPFIVLSSTLGEDLAVHALRQGATDYLLKDRLARLGTAVAQAIEQRRLRRAQRYAEQQLRQSEQRFRALIEHAPDGITMINARGLVLYVSASTERITGYPAHEMLGRDPSELTHPEDLPALLEALIGLMRQPGQNITTQYRFRHKDGSWRWIESTISNLLAEPGIGAMVFNYRDITERRQAEQALHEADTKYRTLIEHIPAIVYQIGIDGYDSLLYVSKQIAQALGFASAEWVAEPRRWLAQVYPRDIDQTIADMARATSDTPQLSEFRILAPDGKAVWLADEAVLVRSESGQPLLLQGIILDITARKHAEAQLHQLNTDLERRVAARTSDLARSHDTLQIQIAERLQLQQQVQASAGRATALATLSKALAEAGHELQPLFDTVAEHVALLIGDATILTVLSEDRQSMQAVGISHPDPQAIVFIRTLFSSWYPASQGVAVKVVQSGEPLLLPSISAEQANEWLTPAYLPYLERYGLHSLLIVPLRARGRILGTLGVSRDRPGHPYCAEDVAFLQDLADRAGLAIENAQLFAAARQARAEADRANRAKSEFLASISHELRTPLNAILGFTGTMLMRLPGPLTADQERQLTTVQRSAKHLLALINDILDLARIEAGKVELRLEPIECQAVIDEVAASLRPLAAQKGLGFAVDAPDERLTITSDARVLGQILINLVNNAIKFTDTGEVRIELAARLPPAGQGSAVIVRVHDTGIGIRAEDQARLFEEFGRVHSLAARDREGTGLGLRLSRRLAGLLGGEIELQSVFGQGSTFTLVLPLP
ncbi:PAS domain S-box protein [Kouleothrix sp.]|uniref:hybrid sensor histidine kinase/response regulator n=1 Tax=Kouleothrix sp. TaxID=2779161 RepID=UPI00391C66C7